MLDYWLVMKMIKQSQTTRQIADKLLEDYFSEEQITLVSRLFESPHLEKVAIDCVAIRGMYYSEIQLTANIKQKWDRKDHFVSALGLEGSRPTKAEEYADGYRLRYEFDELDNQTVLLTCFKIERDNQFCYALNPR